MTLCKNRFGLWACRESSSKESINLKTVPLLDNPNESCSLLVPTLELGYFFSGGVAGMELSSLYPSRISLMGAQDNLNSLRDRVDLLRLSYLFENHLNTLLLANFIIRYDRCRELIFWNISGFNIVLMFLCLDPQNWTFRYSLTKSLVDWAYQSISGPVRVFQSVCGRNRFVLWACRKSSSKEYFSEQR